MILARPHRLLAFIVIAALAALAAVLPAHSHAASPRTWAQYHYISVFNDAWANYDVGSSIEWPVGLVDLSGVTTQENFNYVLCAYAGYCTPGSTEYLYAMNDNVYMTLDDSGQKTAVPWCGQDNHYRVYAPSDLYFYNTSWGRYVVVSGHQDYNEVGVGCGAKMFGYCERVERHILDTLPGPECRECTWIDNWEPLRYDDAGTHIWLNSGYFSQFYF
jgi:hypothetical protein